jgi:hypothetical protein
VTDQNNNPSRPVNRLVTLHWFDNGTCPEEDLAALVEKYENHYAQDMSDAAKQVAKPRSTTRIVQGNAVDVRITSFHGIIDLDKDLYPVLTNARAINEQVFAKAAFSLADMKIDSGDKLFSLREFIHFVQQHWALPGLYIGLSMHVVREIADMAYWKNYPLEFRLDKRGDCLVSSVHFPTTDRDFIINIFRDGIDKQFDPYATLKEWLRFFRNYVKEVAELWTIRIVVNESIAEKIGCLNDDDVVITNVEMLPSPCL